LEAQRHQLRNRLSRFFERNTAIDIDNYRNAGAQFDLATMLGDLNEDNNDEILDIYSLLGSVGGLSQSIADTTLYIDPVNGDDENGTGTVDAPYASIWFASGLPRRIDHKYRILILSDLDMSDAEDPNLCFEFDLGPNGSFALAGVGVPTAIESGLVIGSDETDALINNGGRWVNTTATLSSGHAGAFALAGTGSGDAGYATPINTVVGTDFLTTRNQFSGMVSNDTFDVVTPPVTLTCASMHFMVRGAGAGTSISDAGSQLVICNLNLVYSTTGYYNAFTADIDCHASMTFVRTTQRNEHIFRGGFWNDKAFLDDQLEILIGSTVVNLGVLIEFAGWIYTPTPSTAIWIRSYDSVLYNFSIFAQIIMKGNCTFLYGAADEIYLQSCNATIEYSLFFGVIGKCIDCDNAHASLNSLTFLTAGTGCIGLQYNSDLFIKYCGMDNVYSSISGYGVYDEGLSQHRLSLWYGTSRGPNTASSGLYGTAGKIRYLSSGSSATVSFPARYTLTTIGYSTYVVSEADA
jgi:hypothetical protein